MTSQTPQLLQPNTPDAIEGARALVRAATHGALATLEPGSGHPLASRVGVASLADGTPLILISTLAAHSKSLRADPRCSLLIGEVRKGDPLASARISLICRAEILDPVDPRTHEARERYLAAHPKAQIYIDLPDFSFFELLIERASLNGGFGKAYAFSGDELLG